MTVKSFSDIIEKNRKRLPRLDSLKGKIREKKFVGFDIETYGNDNKFYSCGFYWEDKGLKKFEYFYDKEKAIDFILSRRFRNHLIVATNLGFDITGLFWETKYWNKFNNLSRGGNIILSEYDLGNNNGKIKFIDTFNYVKFGVSQLAEIVGLKKLDKPSFWKTQDLNGKTFYKAIKPKTWQEKNELMIYNQMDCKVTYEFMKFFQKVLNDTGGNLKITIGSCAMDLFRRKFLKTDLIKEKYIIKNDEDITNLIFDSYYGGRTETYARGKIKNLNYYDVNSLYPFSMKKQIPLPQSVRKPNFFSIQNIKNYEGVSQVIIESPNENSKNLKNTKVLKYPLLPFRSKKLLFALGSFMGSYTHLELRKALELGYKIKQITSQIIYTQTIDLFSGYVDTLYNKRLKYQEDKNSAQLIVKLLMNSLYGKWGQRSVENYKVVDIDYLSEADKDLYVYNAKGKYITSDIEHNRFYIYRSKEEKHTNFTFPIIASYITSYARLQMYDLICENDAYYCDTDSLITKNKIKTTSGLGGLKLEDRIKSGILIKPKLYEINGKIKSKGLMGASQSDFDRIIYGKKVYKKKLTKLKESVRGNKKPNTWISIHKTFDLEDDKRKWINKFNKDVLEWSTPRLLKIIPNTDKK